MILLFITFGFHVIFVRRVSFTQFWFFHVCAGFCAITKWKENHTQSGFVYSSLWTQRLPLYILETITEKEIVSIGFQRKRKQKNPILVFIEKKIDCKVKKAKINCYKNCKFFVFFHFYFCPWNKKTTKKTILHKLRVAYTIISITMIVYTTIDNGWCWSAVSLAATTIPAFTTMTMFARRYKSFLGYID